MSSDNGSAQRKDEQAVSNAPNGAQASKPFPLKVLPGAKAGAEIFRQTRYQNEMGQLQIEFRGKSYTLKNWSRTGLAFEVKPEELSSQPGDEIADVKILSSEIVIYSGKIKIVSVRDGFDGKKVAGATFMNNLFLVEGVHAATVVNECSSETFAATEEILNSSPEFCRVLVAFNSALRRFEKTCQQEEQRWKNLSFDQRAEAEKVFLPSLSARMRELFTELDIKMAQVIDVEALPEKSVYHTLVNEQIYSHFQKADLARRAYEKPRGYAGDYEMMNQIYRSSYEGTDLFGKVLHNYITNEHSGESVKFRKPYLHNHLRGQLKKTGTRRVLSIASGPAVEFQEAVMSWSGEELSRLHMTLFDLDREALEHAQTRIIEISSQRDVQPSVSYVNASVKSFLSSQGAGVERFDLIYSAGLFDYLDNATSTALTHKFYGMLNPGGKLILGNFTKDNLTKAFLHLIANWTLIHKTKEEILAWGEGLKGCQKSIEFDDNNMIAFLILEKNADS